MTPSLNLSGTQIHGMNLTTMMVVYQSLPGQILLPQWLDFNPIKKNRTIFSL